MTDCDLQVVSNKVLCSHAQKYALIFAVRVSFIPAPESAGPAHLLAAELASSFTSALPALHISSMCHGAHRIAPPSSAISLQPRSRAWDPTVNAPSAACLHAGTEVTSSLSSSCLPLFKVSLTHGSCPRAYPEPHVSPLSVPVPHPDSTTEHTFMTRQVDFHRSACSEAFSGFPAGWSHSYCAQVSADFCIPDHPRVVRVSLSAAAQPHVAASMMVDGKVVSAIISRSGVEDDSSLGSHSQTIVNIVLVLEPGCHAFSIVYEDSHTGEEKRSCGHVRLPSFQHSKAPTHAELH
jgi:hypothetical protein